MGRHKKERIEVMNDDAVVSRKALKTSAVVFWGKEPVFEKINPLLTSSEREFERQCQIGKALSWYNAMSDEKNKKKYAVEYVEKYLPDDVEGIEQVSIDNFVCGYGPTYAALGRMILRGWPLEDKQEKINIYFHDLAIKATKVETKKEVVEIQKPRDPKVSQFIGMVDLTLDDFIAFYPKRKFSTPSLADTVLKAGATNVQRGKIQEHFFPRILEFQNVLGGKDADLKEAYADKKEAIKKAYDWMTTQPSEELVQLAKKIRKPRKKKVKTAAQILKFFEYQKSDKETKVTSVDPETILGAQQLWVFNTKTRRLGVYYAADEKGLEVSRKSIDNYDEEKSFSKKIRKPVEAVPQVVSAGKVALRHFMDEIRATKSPMKSRICDVVLLVRTIK